MLSLIRHSEELAPNPFVKDCLTEAIIYSTDLIHDSVANTLQITIPRTGLIDKVDVNYSDARYSSIHLLGQLDVHVDGLLDSYRIPIEIQVRTVFEDAWGEIDHRYGYQSRRAIETPTSQPSPQIKAHLLALKKFVDACAEYADVIKDDATNNLGRQKLDKVVPLATDASIEHNLIEIGVPPDFIQRYMAARNIKALADNGNLTPSDKVATHIEAAKKFGLLQSESSDLSDYLTQGSSEAMLLRYYISMGEALCKLSTREKSYIEEAASIYIGLKPDYPTYPTIRFRLGQALSLLDRHEEALEVFRKCRRTIDKVKKFPAERRKYTLPDNDLNKILVGLPKLTGLTYWRMAEVALESGDLVKATQYLEQAYIKTEMALEHSDDTESVTIYNNLLYFSAEFEKVCQDHDLPRKGYFKDQIETCIAYIEERIDLATTSDTKKLDTLAYTYILINQPNKAKLVAERLSTVLLTRVSEENTQLDAGEVFILKRAQELLKKLT